MSICTEAQGEEVVFESMEHMRHLPFFTELASLDEHDESWRAVSAGLVFLRLVDAWIEEGPIAVTSDSWGVRAVAASIEEMPVGMPARAILGNALESLTRARGGDMHAVAPRLMAYARCLDLDAKWALAGDVYETVIAHVHPEEESEIAVNALLRRGHCLRELGDFAPATECFTTAAKLSHQSGDMIGTLRARIGEAKIVVARGNLPAADEILSETVELARQHNLVEVRSLATHDRSHVAHLRGQFDLAVRFAYDALPGAGSDTERDRILNDLAVAFYMLGVKTAARDAFLVLAATGREQFQRWAATINLMELSAEDGAVLQFERYRQQLANAQLPPILRTQFELHAGRAYHVLGDTAIAREWLERAQATASEHSFHQLLFAAESALREVAVPRPSKVQTVASDIPRDIEGIASVIRQMSRLAGVK